MLLAIHPHNRDTWRSGVRSAILEGGPILWILPLYLQVNQKSDDDDDDDVCLLMPRPSLIFREFEAPSIWCLSIKHF